MRFIKYILDCVLDFFEDYFPLAIIVLVLTCMIGGVFCLAWRASGIQAETYKQTTGKRVTQREMFYGGSMFKILPSDIIRK